MKSKQRYIHYLVFFTVLVEVLGLVLFERGIYHNAWDAVLILLFAFTVARISNVTLSPYIVLALGFIAWSMDIARISFPAFDVEAFLWLAMNVYVGVVLGRHMLQSQEISDVEITDAITVFVIGGLAFANMYAMILWRNPDAILHSSAAAGQAIDYSLVVHFSFITQTAVGYGDITPNHPAVRGVTIIQSLFGILYVAVLIARFVSISTRMHSRN